MFFIDQTVKAAQARWIPSQVALEAVESALSLAQGLEAVNLYSYLLLQKGHLCLLAGRGDLLGTTLQTLCSLIGLDFSQPPPLSSISIHTFHSTCLRVQAVLLSVLYHLGRAHLAEAKDPLGYLSPLLASEEWQQLVLSAAQTETNIYPWLMSGMPPEKVPDPSCFARCGY